MSIMKETAIAVPALAALLFVSHTFFGPGDSYYQVTTIPSSWLGTAIPEQRFIAKDLITGSVSAFSAEPFPLERESAGDLTPQARIRSVFAQFVPSGRRPATS